MILVFGKTGQVAIELQRQAKVTSLSRLDADLMTPDACASIIERERPSCVINAAAYTAVDRAEVEREAARAINVQAPQIMAQACATYRIPFVHISSDYVFDGAGDKPFHPTDKTGPLGYYGESKLLGENAVREAGGIYAILRTSWVFSAHGNNFLKTMLRLSETRDELNIVDDQIGGPTPASAIADACLKIAKELQRKPEKSGTYHFSGAPDTSWKGFAEVIFKEAGRNVTVKGIPSSAYPTPALRPLNSRLDNGATEAKFGLRRPDWHKAVKDIIDELGAKA